jgi:hypothetical protein
MITRIGGRFRSKRDGQQQHAQVAPRFAQTISAAIEELLFKILFRPLTLIYVRLNAETVQPLQQIVNVNVDSVIGNT